jgi:hypothetical protein
MKKNQFKSYRGMAAMCAMLTLASCGNDIELTDAQSPVKGAYKVTFTASQESSATRTAIDADDNTKVIWQPGDAITVFDGGGTNCTFEFARYAKIGGETVKTIGEFVGTITNTEKKRYVSLYPANPQAGAQEPDGIIPGFPIPDYYLTGLVLPEEQVATPGGFDPQAAIMIARNDDADGIEDETKDLTLGEFKHVCAFVKVTTTEPYDKITFTANGGENIAGEFRVTVNTEGLVTGMFSGSQSPVSEVSLVPAAGETKIAAGTYLIAILPGELSGGFTMSCTSVDEENSEVTTMVRSYSDEIGENVFSRHNVVNMGTVAESATAAGWTRTTHEYVDLGLNVKWATCNVGATAPTEYGDYFAWGETEGYNSGKTAFFWSTYKWCEGSYEKLTKYNTNSSKGIVDDKTVLELTDDAARRNWGGIWRMPTAAEFEELKSGCYWVWTNNYNDSNVKGLIVYKAKSDYDKGKKNIRGNVTPTASYNINNDNHIFLPAGGYRKESNCLGVGEMCDYWGASLGDIEDSDMTHYAYNMFFNGSSWCCSGSREVGEPVRAVFP